MRLRSAGTSAMRALIDWWGCAKTFFLLTSTLPMNLGVTPKRQLATSSRPEPMRPATPTISPACAFSETPRSVKPKRFSASSTTRPCSVMARLRPNERSRPTMSCTKSLASSVFTSWPDATTFPSRKTVTLSAKSSTSSSMWLTKMTPTPRLATRRTSRKRASTSPRLRAAVGSSKMSRPGLSKFQSCNARTIATAARSPEVSDASGLRTSGASPKRRSSSWQRRASARHLIRPPKPVSYPRPRPRFSIAESVGTRPRS